MSAGASASAEADEELWGPDDPEIYDDAVEIRPEDVTAPL